ncbi:MAG: hypothetical protein WD278_13550 [Pirellulales bacterium]
MPLSVSKTFLIAGTAGALIGVVFFQSAIATVLVALSVGLCCASFTSEECARLDKVGLRLLAFSLPFGCLLWVLAPSVFIWIAVWWIPVVMVMRLVQGLVCLIADWNGRGKKPV